jgi:hypothetical protein
MGWRQRSFTLGLIWAAEQIMLQTGVAPPMMQQPVEEIGIDAWHHFVYAEGTSRLQCVFRRTRTIDEICACKNWYFLIDYENRRSVKLPLPASSKKLSTKICSTRRS